MEIVWVLLAFSTYQSSGIGFTHVFENKLACEIAAETLEKEFWGTAVCIQDTRTEK